MAVNMREKYESLSLAVLRDIAKNRGIKSTSTMRKEAVIDAMLAEDEKAAAAGHRFLSPEGCSGNLWKSRTDGK